MNPMTASARYLRAYDDQLRTDAETPGALRVTRLGPLRLVTFPGGRGFVTYRDLDGADADGIARLVADALGHFRADAGVDRVEWKSRGHDRAPGLHEALSASGFVPEAPESIMIGPLQALLSDAGVPAGVRVRRVTSATDVRAMSAAVDEAFGDPVDTRMAEVLLARLARGDGMELWAAEADGRFVCGGRLEPVPGTDFVGIWGGATLPGYRGRGIYRAVLDARARSALATGKTLVHSDSTEDSRPILQRSGLLKVSTTTPYQWTR
jgi:GNAT superfamily N-acetyltransferase